MHAFLREHSWPVAASVLLHALLALALVVSAMIAPRNSAPSLQPLPIDAVVVDSQVLHAAQQAQADRAAEAAARVQAEAKAAAEAKATADAKAAADAKEAADAAAQSETDARAAEEAKTQAEAQARAETRAKAEVQAKADAAVVEAAERAAEAKKAAQAKQAAAARQAADAKQAAEAKVAEEKHAADDKAKREREAELRRQMAEEEHTSAVESGPLRDRYISLLRNRIQNAWIKPPSAHAGVDCLVEVTQVAGGEVTTARVTQCNGDAAVRQSIENAVYRASPLPDPPDPALFERNFVFRFKPNE